MKRVAAVLFLLAVCVPANAQSNPTFEEGMKPFGSYSGGNFDSVSITNGKLSLAIPLVSYPQRGDLQVGFEVQVYNNVFQRVDECLGQGTQNCLYYWDWLGDAGVHIEPTVGFKIVLDSIGSAQEGFRTIYSIETPDGAVHRMGQLADGTWETLDATAINYNATTNVAIDRNGARYYFTGNPPVLNRVEDRNGNKVNFSTSALTDTLGRVIPLPSSAVPTSDFSGCAGPRPTVSAALWNLPGPNGSTYSIKICHATVTIRTYFHFLNSEASQYYDEVVQPMSLIQSIVLPNGLAWVFEYGYGDGSDPNEINYGDLTAVVLPTGGRISYVWDDLNLCNSIETRHRAVGSRIVDAGDGSQPGGWGYFYSGGGGGAPAPTISRTVTDPLGNAISYTLSSLGNTCSYYETERRIYQGSGSTATLLKTTTTTYSWNLVPTSFYPVVKAAVNVVPTSITTAWANGQTSKVTKTYDSGFTFEGSLVGTYGNVLNEKTYDWGAGAAGGVLRETVYTYLPFSNTNYKNNHLMGLVSSVVIKDSVGAQKALTNFSYDGYSLQSSGITTQRNTSPPNSTFRGNQTSISRWLNTNGTYQADTKKYFDTGVLYQSIDTGNHTTTFSYSSTFAGAYPTQVQYPTTGTVTHIVSSNYDFNSGLLLSSTDENNQTTAHTYDDYFRLIRTNSPGGGETIWSYSDNVPLKVTISTKIDATKTQLSELELDGLARVRKTRLLSDPQGTTYTRTLYDNMGRVQQTWNPTRCDPDSYPDSCTGESTFGKTITQYDALGRPVKLALPDGTLGAYYVITSYDGNATTVIDQAGRTRRTKSDGLGRLVQVDESTGQTAQSYWGTSGQGYVGISGTLRKIWECEPDPDLGEICYWIYDFGYVSMTVNGFTKSTNYPPNAGTTIAGALATAFNSDANSPVTATASSTTVYFTAKAAGENTNYTLSAASGTQSPYFTGSSYTVTPSGPTLTGGIGNGQPRTLYTLTNPATTYYQYDPMDNLTRAEQRGGTTDTTKWRIRTFTYNSLSQLLTANNPEAGTVTWAYDTDGKVISKADARSITINYSYDELHRPIGKTYSNGDPAVTWSYDQPSFNGLTITNGKGRRTGMSDSSTTVAWSYDVEGQVKAERRTLSGITKTVAYDYNLDGSLWKLTYPYADGQTPRVVEYAYSAAGRALSAKDVATALEYAKLATYAPHGALATTTVGASGGFFGMTVTNAYNNRLQPALLSAAAPSQTVLSVSYDWNLGAENNGTIKKIINNRNTNRSQNFTYDHLNRILSAWTDGPNWGNTFVYDAWGNLLQKNQMAGKTDGEYFQAAALSNNRLSSYGYDASGNMTNDGTQTMTYDAENRIKAVNGVTYTYDGEGERVKKSNGKLYWMGKFGAALAESDLSGNVTAEYIFFNGKRVARRDSPSGAVAYYFSDHLGSASVITNANGGIVEESDFYPFGGERPVVSNDPNQYKFTGKERDLESTFDYFGARYYSSRMGRFLTPDWSATPDPVPYADISNPQTLNLYSYVENNPITGTDPEGHFRVGGADDKKAPPAGTNLTAHAQQQQDQKAKKAQEQTTQPKTGGFWQKLKNLTTGNGWVTDAQRDANNFKRAEEERAIAEHWERQNPGMSYAENQRRLARLRLRVSLDLTFVAGFSVPGAAASATAAAATSAGAKITFGHGARHLVNTGLAQDVVEAAIRADVQGAVSGAATTGNFWGKVVVDGKTIVYRAYKLADGTINVGTYYPK